MPSRHPVPATSATEWFFPPGGTPPAEVEVPTLIPTPGHHVLIGETAAAVLRTGHMFRFTHPARYSQAIEAFLAGCVDGRPGSDTPAVSTLG